MVSVQLRAAVAVGLELPALHLPPVLPGDAYLPAYRDGGAVETCREDADRHDVDPFGTREVLGNPGVPGCVD